MQEDFHYYATYVASYLAGYSHEESLDICYSAQFVDLCSKTLLRKIGAPSNAATTQLQLEMMDMRTDFLGLQDITRIWSSFHFLPYDLRVKKKWHSKAYMDKFRLICNTNGELVKKTVMLAKGEPLQAVGVAMHVLADTWAHRYFAGTPSYVINNVINECFEIMTEDDCTGPDSKQIFKKIQFVHSLSTPDDYEHFKYTNSVDQMKETAIMNLGHGRAGHLPDYSYITYRYVPAWGGYDTVIKNNPEDYYKAFCQMVYAMKYLRGEVDSFELDTYDNETVEPYRREIDKILRIRRLNSSGDWKALGERISGCEIPDFDLDRYLDEYKTTCSEEKCNTFIGEFVTAALKQKAMVSQAIYDSGNMLAGIHRRKNDSGIGKRLKKDK